MSYQTDDGEHDGWAAVEFPGDRFSSGSEQGGVRVRHFTPGPITDAQFDSPDELVDGREAIGWRGLCTCGWRGPFWQRTASPAEHDLDNRRFYVDEPDPFGDCPSPIEELIHREWKAHLPSDELAAIANAMAEQRHAQARVDDAVRVAREHGHSWAEIGVAAGMTRQSAHERWGRRPILFPPGALDDGIFHRPQSRPS